jgi:hypothetical protein
MQHADDYFRQTNSDRLLGAVSGRAGGGHRRSLRWCGPGGGAVRGVRGGARTQLGEDFPPQPGQVAAVAEDDGAQVPPQRMGRHDAEIAADVGDDGADRPATDLGGDLFLRGQASEARVLGRIGGLGVRWRRPQVMRARMTAISAVPNGLATRAKQLADQAEDAADGGRRVRAGPGRIGLRGWNGELEGGGHERNKNTNERRCQGIISYPYGGGCGARHRRHSTRRTRGVACRRSAAGRAAGGARPPML